ncbi:hypothetical protein ACFUN8_06365 [Streptomyces sp. NPDC057307]|uniref:hypothetical protein n=1 Tax=Streptomyces sp. NPDC057307 TaxID=3346096 RepID=UPI00363D5C56
MSRRSSPLPPPPPPVHIRTWPDEQALLAERARILDWLVGHGMGPARLTQFLLLVGGMEFGWLMAGGGLQGMIVEDVDPITLIFGVLLAAFGLGVLTAAGIVLGLLLRRDVAMHRLTRQWAALASDPVGDRRLRLPGVSLCWLLISFLVGVLGLWLSLETPASARRGEDTYGEVAYVMGAGALLWIGGLIGVTKAVTHYRWAVRLLAAGRPRPAGQ